MSESSLDQVTFLHEFRECYKVAKELLLRNEPAFLGRVGGSDTDLVLEYFDLIGTTGLEKARSAIATKADMIKRFNGYYDTLSNARNIPKFCDLLLDSYKACQDLLVCGPLLLSEFFPESINAIYRIDTSAKRSLLCRFLGEITVRQPQPRLYPYGFVEQILFGQETLFRLFAEILPGSRVLVISPFSSSILENFKNRSRFFKNYKYPEFDLATYNTPITYAGLPPNYYPDADWFETLERMKREIAALDFDIALLSCGSYAMPLGVFVRDTLKRKAVYVGGCLQLYFGIMGRRYENIHFSSQIDSDAFIYPLERDKYFQHVVVQQDSATEAFGAYF